MNDEFLHLLYLFKKLIKTSHFTFSNKFFFLLFFLLSFLEQLNFPLSVFTPFSFEPFNVLQLFFFLRFFATQKHPRISFTPCVAATILYLDGKLCIKVPQCRHPTLGNFTQFSCLKMGNLRKNMENLFFDILIFSLKFYFSSTTNIIH